jgi:hypothetical protein
MNKSHLIPLVIGTPEGRIKTVLNHDFCNGMKTVNIKTTCVIVLSHRGNAMSHHFTAMMNCGGALSLPQGGFTEIKK